MNHRPENQGIANQQTLASRKISDSGLASFGEHQRYASEQYQRELAVKRQQYMGDLWKLPNGIVDDIMTLLVPALPFLMLAAIVIIAIHAASSR